METAVMKLYEGLFLVDSADAAADWSAVTGAVEKILSRAGAEVVSLDKWDERKLAYDMKGKSIGTYILTYFNCETSKIGAIERDVQLSEQILRVMILTTERMSEADIKKDTPSALTAKAAEAAAVRAAEKAAVEEAEAAAAEKAALEAEAAAKAEAEVAAEAEPEESSAEAVAEPEESSVESATEAEPAGDEAVSEPEVSSEDAVSESEESSDEDSKEEV